MPGVVRLLLAILIVAAATTGFAAEPEKRLLILSQGPDGHPRETHEYVAGARIMSRLVRDVPGLTVRTARADGLWLDGPAELRAADGVFLFLSEGAKWLSADERRQQAFAELAARKGGLVVLHWAMGTREAAPITAFQSLFGGCHGGPDRKYVVTEADVKLATPNHPIVRGIGEFRVRDEFYYALKFQRHEPPIVPIWNVEIDGSPQTVAWAWQRPDGGRSFGFSGGHFHANWRRPEYQRLLSQAVLWSLDLPVPERGFPAALVEEDFALAE